MLEEKSYAAAAAILNVMLQDIASTHTVGTKVEIYPLDENQHNQVYPKLVSKDHVNGLLFNLGCLYKYGSSICMKRDMGKWNNYISSHNYEFTVCGKKRVICLHIKQIPRDLIAVNDHGNNVKVRVQMQQSPLHNTDTTNKQRYNSLKCKSTQLGA